MRCSEMLFLVLMCLFISSCTQKESAKDLGGMVKIEGGSYVVGLDPSIAVSECKKYSPDFTCLLRLSEDTRPHQETVGTFHIDKYEVTQAEYERVMGKNPSHFTSWFSRCPTCPVESVGWFDAGKYCEKVGKRLPTEWEWEKAADGGRKTIYAWGNNGDMAGDYAWYQENSGGKTHPVGEKMPNGYGLYDMAGNVEEWTDSEYLYDGKYVLRGGKWKYLVTPLGTYYRVHESVMGDSGSGFRCAQSEKNQQSAKVESANQTPAPSEGTPSSAPQQPPQNRPAPLEGDVAAKRNRVAENLNDSEAHKTLGMTYGILGRWQEAVAEFQEAIRLKPDYVDAHYDLGLAYGNLGRWQEAVAEYKEAIRLNPDDAEAHNNLSVAYRNLGHLPEAVAEYKEAIRLNLNLVKAQ